MSWYYAKDKEQLGPIDDASLSGLVESGEITPETLVWKEGMAAWTPYAEAVSGGPTTVPIVRSAEIQPPVAGVRYAGFWIRFVAKLVDSLIMVLVTIVPLIALLVLMVGTDAKALEEAGNSPVYNLIFNGVCFAVSAAYSIFFIGKYGATPGKMLCKIHVVDVSGTKIGYGRATGRFFAEILSAIICYIGYFMVAFDSKKRGLHDHICRTLVVYK